MKPNDRFSWAVEMLHVDPSDHILEIGCGHGIAISMIAGVLKTGTITAIDQSAAMISKASRKNQGNGAVLLKGTFPDVHMNGHRFDKIFAFNVNVFLKDPGRELLSIKSLLAPEGALYLFFQPPPADGMAITQHIADEACARLRKANFSIIDVLFKKIPPSPCACIIAR